MKNFNVLFLVALVSFFVLKAVYSDRQDAPEQSDALAQTNYGLRGGDDSWPPIEGATTAVADDLTKKNYYVVVDGSGSMETASCGGGAQKMLLAQKAVANFFDQLPGDANFGLFVFDVRGAYERLPLDKNSKAMAIDIIQDIRAGGGTPLSSSIAAGRKALTQQAVKQLGYGEYHLVVVTDGEASPGFSPDSEIDYLLGDTPILVHTIGFCIGSNHALNRPGQTLYRSAKDYDGLSQGLGAVLAEAPDFQPAGFAEE